MCNHNDNEKQYILSICIPSYNRPDEIYRLLNSIDSKRNDIEIIVCEDKSPRRDEVRKKVKEYSKSSPYDVHYYENEENYGYDKNIRKSGEKAQGKWVMYMGDDDLFIEESLDQFIAFLEKYDNVGYVLRRYRNEYSNGVVEEFRYSNADVFFASGENSIIELFRRSLFISGFTYKKEWFDDYDCSDYDGTLLFQLYIQATICLKHPSAYCDIPITKAIEGGTPFFGSSKSEKDLYESGKNTVNNSINFMKQVRVLAESFDQKNNTNITEDIMMTYSKYSLGFLHEHREEGVKVFRHYAKELEKLGYNRSKLFYVYYYSLLILGKKNTFRIIRLMKRVKGNTPKL